MSLLFHFGEMSFPYCVESEWEEKSRGPISCSREMCPVLSFDLSPLSPQPRESTWPTGSLLGLLKLSQMMKTKKSGKGSFISESQIVLLLVSVPFPKASSPGFPSIPLKFKFLLCLN